METDNANELGAYFSANINDGKRYQYLTFKGERHCEITYIGDRILTTNPIPEQNPIVKYLLDNLLWISICLLELIIILIVACMKKQVRRDCVESKPLI